MGCRIPRGDVLAQGPPLCLMASWKGVSYNVFRSTLTGPACPCPGFWGSQWSPGLSITPPREACLSREKSVSSEGRATSSEGGTREAMSPAGGLRQWWDFRSWLLGVAGVVPFKGPRAPEPAAHPGQLWPRSVLPGRGRACQLHGEWAKAKGGRRLARRAWAEPSELLQQTSSRLHRGSPKFCF